MQPHTSTNQGPPSGWLDGAGVERIRHALAHGLTSAQAAAFLRWSKRAACQKAKQIRLVRKAPPCSHNPTS
jgi:uncharacterized protein YoaH (UPF0181 family)